MIQLVSSALIVARAVLDPQLVADADKLTPSDRVIILAIWSVRSSGMQVRFARAEQNGPDRRTELGAFEKLCRAKVTISDHG